MHTSCLCSEILQENTSMGCPSGAVGSSLEPDAPAREETSHGSHTWPNVRGSVGVEIMPLIPSAAAVQETLVERSVWLPIVFNVCVRSPWSCQTRCAAVWTARRGSFADFADFEQCTQVSPANEPSAQRAQRESSARGFNQGRGIWGAELFMPVLAPDQRTWYKMQISIEFLEVAPVCLCHKVEGGEWQFPWIRTQNAGGAQTDRLVFRWIST